MSRIAIVSFEQKENARRPTWPEEFACYDRLAIVPNDIKVPGLITCEFPQRWFESSARRQELLLTRGFYERFRQYDYIMVDHLEGSAAPIRNLEQFCGYDFLASPCRRGRNNAGDAIAAGQGPGAFSLRRVSAFLRVCARSRPWRRWKPVATLPECGFNENYFWARRAGMIDPLFNVAPDTVAFSFVQSASLTEAISSPSWRDDSAPSKPVSVGPDLAPRRPLCPA